MTVDLALYQPDIPQNTGTLLRLGACLGIRVHVIHPTGFAFSKSSLRRTALDYLDLVDYREHVSYETFDQWRKAEGRRLVLLSTKATRSAYGVTYGPNDILMVGRESAGVPAHIAARVDLGVRIPMAEGLRSINVALAAGLVLGEAMRQTGAFKDLR